MEVKNDDKRWIIKEHGDQLLVRRLSKDLGIDSVLANLLVQRGITTAMEAKEFFHPDLSKLNDPFLMEQMHIAVERLHAAIENGEGILIYGDYDVDGTTAVALFYSFVSRFTKRVDYYIPDRYEEGYGISYKGVDYALENGYSLIVALDCGIKAVDKVKYAKERGIDFIICDHHLPDDSLPEAVAVLDPKLEGCNYPFDDLCGCGVGFKLVQGYAQQYNIPFEEISSLLDLVLEYHFPLYQ